MNTTAAKITVWTASALVVVGLGVLAAPAVASTVKEVSGWQWTTPAASTVEEFPVEVEPSVAPTSAALPEWAKESLPWIVYPPDYECWGTEGCGNDYVAFFGPVTGELPEGVVYFNQEEHGWARPSDAKAEEWAPGSPAQIAWAEYVAERTAATD